MRRLAGDTLSADEAKTLIYARETGLVDNMACRDFSGLDTLQASSLLRRLRDRVYWKSREPETGRITPWSTMPRQKTGTLHKENCLSKVVTQPLKVVSEACHLCRRS